MDTPAVSQSSPVTSLGKDFVAGFLVFLIALPLCLGIALASGYPPIAGVMTAIVGGAVVNFLGSARLTIKGPAAGLIVIAIGAVTELGQGDAVAGYKLALAVGVVAAALQILMALLRAASAGTAMPTSVVHGMLAAIGVIIFAKQAHIVLGVVPDAHGPLALLAAIPSSIRHANPEIALIGVTSLIVLFGYPRIKKWVPWLRRVPPQLVVLVLAVTMGFVFDLGHAHQYHMFGADWGVGPSFLVRLPGKLSNAIVFPDFSQITSATSIKYILMFSLVGTVESTLSVIAVDTLDPAKRASNLDRDLLVVGAGNLISAFIGGLPMISEIVRSKANIDAGATSRFANFFHGMLLLAFVALAPGLLQHIPLAALAAMLVYTGSQLASPKEFVHVRELGIDQLVLFLTTLITTLATDLLIGVGVGLLLKVVLHVVRGVPLTALMRGECLIDEQPTTLQLRFPNAAIFTAVPKIRRMLAGMPSTIDRVVFDLSEARLVDHTFLERVYQLEDEQPRARFELVGMEQLVPASSNRTASRRRP